MSTTSETRTSFWREHFQSLAQAEPSSQQTDFSNQAIIVQNFAYMLEACGIVEGKRVLDAGFGGGELSRMMSLLGAEVTAFDVVATRIARLREEAPEVAWWQDDISTWMQPKSADKFDIVLACETLQYVEFNNAVQRFLSVLAPAGRLVILIPNSDCPVVNRVTNRFEHKYDGVSMIGLRKRLSHLTRDYYVAYRGIHFRQDQVIAPYQSGPWQQIISDSAPKSPHISVKTGSVAQIPNRVQVAIVKSGGEPFQKILSTA